MSEFFGDWDIGALFDSGASETAAGAGDLFAPGEIPDGAFVTAAEAAQTGSGGGFWDSAGNWVSNNSGGLLRGLTSVGGAVLGTNANNAAASTATNAANQAAQIQADAQLRAVQMQLDASREARGETRAAGERGIAAIRAGTQGYADTIAPLLTERPIMLPTYRGMTDAQQIGRTDLIAQGQKNLATSGLRGSGAGVKSLLDADRRFVADATSRSDADRLSALRTSRASADSARSGLAQVRAQEGGSIANTEIGQGNRQAESIASDGRVQAAGTTAAAGATAGAVTAGGQANANAGLANAGQWTDVLGTLGSVIAGSTKDSNRDRYTTNGGMI